MRFNFRIPVAALLALALVTVSERPASAQFSVAEINCRATVVKNGAKLSKTILKTQVTCHKLRGKDGALSSRDCNDIDQADTKGKVAKIETKLTEALTSATGKCGSVDPADVLYAECPAPCAGAIDGFDDVAQCVICLARANAESFSSETLGSPASPLTGDSAKCQSSIGKEGAKLYNAIIKDVSKCQSTAEKAGTDTTIACTDTNFPSSAIGQAGDKAFGKIASACASATFTDLDSCGASQIAIADCVAAEATDSGQDIISSYLALQAGTTTTTTPPTTTLPNSEACPDLGQLVLYSTDSKDECVDDDGCTPPRTCDTALGICRTPTELDSGWTGLAHDSDINDQVITQAFLDCPGGSPVCGVCEVEGLDPSTDNCRCANDPRTICQNKFASDLGTCGKICVGGGTKDSQDCTVNANCVESGNTCMGNGKCSHTNSRSCTNNAQCNLSGTCTGVEQCLCYFGSPFPLSSGGTPACVVNRFAEDVSGTANVDTGEGAITANLKSQVFLGITTANPCPRCQGDPIVQDGVRGGTCVGGRHDGLSCDVNGINASFPAVPAPGDSGGGYSLDCMPDVGKNVSGAGLTINLTQTSGTASLSSNVDCDGTPGGPLCPCKTCSNDTLKPCNADGECTGLGSCAQASIYSCSTNNDCLNKSYGACLPGIFRCELATHIDCTGNPALCSNQNAGPCNPPTCSDNGGSATQPLPNQCTVGGCTDLGGGEGRCTNGPDNKFCDGLVKANGDGILTCLDDSGCTPAAVGVDAGQCMIIKRRECFLDPIVAVGAAHTEFPVGAAAFCIPPTSSPAINSVAGLPGPGRIRNQASSKTFCATDHGVQYEPGVGGCPPAGP